MKAASLALSLLTLSGLAVQIAHAEGALMRAQPAADSVVTEYDGNVITWFSGNVSKRAPTLIVVDGGGNRVDNGDVDLELGPRSKLSVSTKSLPSGPYVVRYRVLTLDGLVVSGIYRFTIAQP